MKEVTNKPLARLTPTLLRRAEAKGKTAGWHKLCLAGYLPAEISLYAEPCITRSDVVTRIREYSLAHDLPVPVSCAQQRRSPTYAAPADWRAAFRASVMRVGLILHLTQPMLEYLCATADEVMWDRWGQSGSSLARPNNTLTTEASLEKRGLIRRKPQEWFEGRIKGRTTDTEFHDAHFELTEAGQHVVDLLKSVGVFVPADEALRRKETAR